MTTTTRAAAPARVPARTLCATCGVETDLGRTGHPCAICADERQYLPAGGQRWTTLDELRAAGHAVTTTTVEPDLIGLTITPSFGIGQTAYLVRTPDGVVMWDCLPYVDDAAVDAVRAVGPVIGLVASHPHTYGAQTAWSAALGDIPVWVNAADAEWVRLSSPAVREWSGRLDLASGVTVHQLGGHFPGSAVLEWQAGADGRGVLLTGDTIFTNADRTSVSFMRSYPNRIPLPGGVALRLAERTNELHFDRLYNLFNASVDAGAQEVVGRSAERHARWCRSDDVEGC